MQKLTTDLLHGGVDVGSSLGAGVLQLALLDAPVSSLPLAKNKFILEERQKGGIKGILPLRDHC